MKPNVSSSSSSSEYHLFEADRCSGILVFIVDSNDPVQLKFSEKIKIQVIFDNPINISQKDISDVDEQSGGLQTQNTSQKADLLLLKEDLSEDGEIQKNEHLDNSSILGLRFNPINKNDYSALESTQHTHNGIVIGEEEYNRLNGESDTIISNQEEQCLTGSEKGSRKGKRKRLSKSKKLQEHKKKSRDNGDEISLNNQSKHQLRSSSRSEVGSRKVKQKFIRTTQETQEVLQKSYRKEKIKSKMVVDKNGRKCKKLKKEDRTDNSWKNLLSEAIPDEKDIFTSLTNKGRIENVIEIYPEENVQQNKKSKPQNSISKARKSMSLNSEPKKINTKSGKLLLQKDVICPYCGVTFDTKLDFYNHRRIKGSSFICKVCGKEEPFEGHLMVHMQSHKPEKGHVHEEVNERTKQLVKKRFKMKCDVCGLVVSSSDSLKIHMMLHTEEHPYKCCVCPDQRFFSLSSLRHHLLVHLSSERIRCTLCDMGFASRAELGKHQLTHKLKCGLCEEIFPNKTSRNCHYRVSHPNDILKCILCFNLFSTESELQKHMIYHRHNKREQCPECGLVVSKLKEHMNLHTRKNGEKLFACDQCSMRYLTKAMLQKHRLSHTGERPYACNKCTKRFRSNGMLRKHLLIHTLERPFVCDVCGKRFSVRSNLGTHMKTHSNTRNYPCNFCSQAFNYKNSLNIHLKAKHRNETQASITCPHCSKSFQDNTLLTSHILAEHSELKAAECHPPSLTPNQQKSAQIPMEISSLSFIADNLQAYHNDMDANLHNALQVTNTIDLTAIETVPSLLNKGSLSLSNHINSTLSSTTLESVSREEILNYLGRDGISPYGHPPGVLTLPPSLQLLPSMSLDPQPSSSVNALSASHPLPPSNGLVETTATLEIKTLQDSSSLDEQSQFYPMFHNL